VPKKSDGYLEKILAARRSFHAKTSSARSQSRDFFVMLQLTDCILTFAAYDVYIGTAADSIYSTCTVITNYSVGPVGVLLMLLLITGPKIACFRAQNVH